MLQVARRHNRYGERCQYRLNDRDDLVQFADGAFDLVYSHLVLQHMAPSFSRRYIQEFIRILRPGGLAIFQVPSPPEKISETTEVVTPQTLEDPAYAAELVLPTTHLYGKTGQHIQLPVIVKNYSPRAWPSGVPLNLGNHWHTQDGQLLQFDDVRVPVPLPLPPGEAVEVQFPVTFPAVPGDYRMEIDVVHENYCWFQERGSIPAFLTISISGAPPQDDAPFLPQMMMEGLFPHEVGSAVEAAQGIMLETEREDSAGGGWESYFYLVQKRTL